MSSFGNRSFQGLGFKADAARRLDDLARSVGVLESDVSTVKKTMIAAKSAATTVVTNKSVVANPAGVVSLTNAVGQSGTPQKFTPYPSGAPTSLTTFIGTRVQRQDHTTYPQFDPTAMLQGTQFFETDTQLIYVVKPDPLQMGTPNNWFYGTGIWQIYWPDRNAPFSVGEFGAYDWNYTDANVLLLVSDQQPPSPSGNGSLIYTVQLFTGTGITAVYHGFYDGGEYVQELAVVLPVTVPSTPSSPLLPSDKGFRCNCPGAGHTWQWDGISAWAYVDGNGSGWTTFDNVGPTGTFIPVAPGGGSYTISQSSGGTASVTVGAWISPITGGSLYLRY